MTHSSFSTARSAEAVLAAAEAEGRRNLLEHEVYALLSSVGVDVPRHLLVDSADRVDLGLCSTLASEEVVVKVVSPEILHKTDIGGIALCRNSPEALREAVGRVLDAGRAVGGARIRGALVVERVRFRPGWGREILAGFRHDTAFGPVVVLGLGGLDTEYLLAAFKSERGRAIRSATGLTLAEASAALQSTVVQMVLSGGLRSDQGNGAGAERLASLAVALAMLAERLSGFTPPAGLGLAELEVNPLVAADDGRLIALDGLARLHRPEPLPAPRPIERLRFLLEPKSAVVLGASAEGMNPGRIILRNLIEGGGIPKPKIWVMHPRAETIDGCRAFAAAADLPEPADLAIVSIPADKGADRAVIELVESRRARSVTLISGGFGETEGGKAAEAAMRVAIDNAHRAEDRGVLVNGGNCLGIISVPGGYNTFFLPPYKLPFNDGPGRNIVSVSQSGAYLVTQISNLDRALRPRYAISFGNQIDVTVSDYLEYLEREPSERAVQVVAVYLEGFQRGDGARFLASARRLIAQGRAVLLYKAGRSAEGRAAAASHTASAVGDYDVCRDLVRSAGVVVSDDLDTFEDYVLTFTFLAGRAVNGRRIAVLSNAGFECTAAADKLFGMQLARFRPETEKRLGASLPGIVDVHNPVDATPVTPTEKYAECVKALLEDRDVDAAVIAGVPATPALDTLVAGAGHREDISKESSLPSRLIEIFRQTPKPVVFSVDAGSVYEPLAQMLRQAGLPCFRRVDRATRALAAFLGANR